MKNFFFLVVLLLAEALKREGDFLLPFLPVSVLLPAKCPQSLPRWTGTVVCSDLFQ